MVARLEVGDRVRTHASRPIPAGTLGRIALILISVPDMYFVQFDGEDRPTLMHGSELELVAEANERAA